MTTTPSRRRLDSGEPLSPTTTCPIAKEDSPSGKKRPHSLQRSLSREIKRCPNRIPFLNRLPPRLRLFLLLTWLLWKVTITLLFLRLLWAGASKTSPWYHHYGSNQAASLVTAERPTRILYIVTALAEYNNGKRETVKGQDRLGEVLVPVLVDSVNSLVSYDYKVDVYLILGYKLRPERREMISNRLPSGVGLQVWDDATPLGYPDEKDPNTMTLNTRALSRQHRFVVKEKLNFYDLFMAWEDDIRITGEHVRHFLQMSAELKRLYEQAPLEVEDVPEDMNPKRMKFFGKMTKRQMKRLIPGFVRVEVLLDNEENVRALDDTESPLPLDHDFNGESHFDSSICCHVPDMQPNNGIPKLPSLRDAVVWETNVTALSLRQLPDSSMLDWVVLLPGPGKMLQPEDLIGGYWSGRDGAFGDFQKPTPGVGSLFAQQGGWMATREQIIQLHSDQCHGSFLPPYDTPAFPQDGHYMKNVEFWSGGYQFFTGVRGGCNMQRLISFHPDSFSKHFIYHTANNKQKQLSKKRLVRADDLFAQLNSIRRAAERTKAEIMKQK